MKKMVIFICLLVSLLSPLTTFASSPKSIAGFTLGVNINNLSDKVDMKTAVPIWGAEYLTRVAIVPPKGYQSGYIDFANCKNIGSVIRIKLNYLDDSSEFYDQLLSTMTQRYGKPSEWRGNPFGNLKIWKWSLMDEDKNSISIILQRYEGDDDAFTQGNSIKMAMTNLAEQEKQCFKARKKENNSRKSDQDFSGKENLDWFLPQ